MGGFDRFELEEAIMELAQSESDIKLVNEMILDEGVTNTDLVSNALLGVETMTIMRLQKVMRIFEQGVKEGKIQ